MGLFGSPVGHSASPEMYNFCFQHDGLDYAYLAFDVKAEDMPETINTIRLLKMRGGNFTMPCKNIAAKLMDRLSPAAELIGACNAFVNEEGVLTGYITDGIGFVKNLKEHGVEVKGKKVLVLGAGAPPRPFRSSLPWKERKKSIFLTGRMNSMTELWKPREN